MPTMDRRQAKNILALGAILSWLFVPLPALGEPAAITSQGERLLDHQKKFQRLKKGMEGQRALVKEAREKEEGLLNELENLTNRIALQRSRIEELKQRLTLHEQRLAEKTAELEEARQEKKKARSHVERRLAARYKMGELGTINVLFSQTSLHDLLLFEEYFHRLVQRDNQTLSRYRERVQRIQEAEAAVRREKAETIAAIARIKQEEEQLAETIEKRKALLERVRTERKLYILALQELEEAAENLANTIETLKQRTSQATSPTPQTTRQLPSKRRPENFSDITLHKGRLLPPVRGTVTTTFGRNQHGKFGIATQSRGIDIKTAPGEKIRAIYGGKVVYVGKLKGYGKIIIIDHGGHYYSLMSRAEKFFKKEGDEVRRNEVVGVMGVEQGLIGEGLHFEIRHGTKPENPLHWVDNGALKITAVPETP